MRKYTARAQLKPSGAPEPVLLARGDRRRRETGPVLSGETSGVRGGRRSLDRVTPAARRGPQGPGGPTELAAEPGDVDRAVDVRELPDRRERCSRTRTARSVDEGQRASANHSRPAARSGPRCAHGGGAGTWHSTHRYLEVAGIRVRRRRSAPWAFPLASEPPRQLDCRGRRGRRRRRHRAARRSGEFEPGLVFGLQGAELVDGVCPTASAAADGPSGARRCGPARRRVSKIPGIRIPWTGRPWQTPRPWFQALGGGSRVRSEASTLAPPARPAIARPRP